MDTIITIVGDALAIVTFTTVFILSMCGVIAVLTDKRTWEWLSWIT